MHILHHKFNLLDKKKVFLIINEALDLKISEQKKAANNAQESANQESKSSAGDKYETGRAMAQNDKAMVEIQLLSSQNDKAILSNINFDQKFDTVRLGCIVKTNIGTFVIAISVGKILVDDESLMVVSKESPIGKLILGRKVGEKTSFNSREITILEIY